MSRLDQLPEISDHVLSGLRADDSLKYRIYQKAAAPSGQKAQKNSRLPLAALCAISVVMIALFVILNPMITRNNPTQTAVTASQDTPASQIQTIQAGAELDESPIDEKNEKDSETEKDPEDPSGEDDADENETGRP